MAHEIEAIPTPDTSTAPAMREPKVVEPYRSRTGSKITPQTPTSPEATAPTPTPTDRSGTGVVAGEEPTGSVKTVKLSPQMAALARREQRFLEQQKQLEADQKAIEADRQEIADLRQLKKQLAEKDFSGIENQVPYADYVAYLNKKTQQFDPQAEATRQLTEKIESLEAAQKETLDSQEQAAIRQTRQEVADLVKESVDFSSIRELGQIDTVVQHILDTWEHDEVLLTPEEAAKEVEQVLVEQAKKLAGITKLKPAQETGQNPEGTAVKTLTNNMGPQSDSKGPRRPFQGMSDSERWAEARRRAEEKIRTQTG
jgi:hypothetical protein